jgi:hypothetical protein
VTSLSSTLLLLRFTAAGSAPRVMAVHAEQQALPSPSLFPRPFLRLTCATTHLELAQIGFTDTDAPTHLSRSPPRTCSSIVRNYFSDGLYSPIEPFPLSPNQLPSLPHIFLCVCVCGWVGVLSAPLR